MSLRGTRVVGSRYASKVKIKHGAFAGERGIVVRVAHESCVLVRMTTGRWNGITLTFGPSEMGEIG